MTDLAAGLVDFEWTTIALVSDDPAKGLGKAALRDLLFPRLMALLSRPGRSVDLVSAYFVPGRQFALALALADLARNGTRVRILTNSLDATDVVVVHSAYVTYRPVLLRAGVELYELKPAFAADAQEEARTGSGIVAGEPALQDHGGGRGDHLHRLVQLRPALVRAQHRDGGRDPRLAGGWRGPSPRSFRSRAIARC